MATLHPEERAPHEREQTSSFVDISALHFVDTSRCAQSRGPEREERKAEP